jgi:hypothetical protein
MSKSTEPNKKNHITNWHNCAGELAHWFLARLANRHDAYGAYYDGGQVTRRGTVDRSLLIRHCRAYDGRNIIGLHTADADNRSKGGALDIDQHGDDPLRAEANRLAALHWYGVLVRMGIRPLLTASNGKGGYHLRVLLAEAIDAARVYHFLRRLTADHRKVRLDKPPEQFPKQPDVRKCAKGLGNWIRLPGRHHKRDYWSEVWDGSRWLAGHDAIKFMLALTGDDPRLIPEAAPEPAVQPRRVYTLWATGGNIDARIAAYMARLPNLAKGQGRDDVAFRFAAFLVRDLALTDAAALNWLEGWDKGNSPPKGRDRLAEIIENAHDYGQNASGCGLTSDRPRSRGRRQRRRKHTFISFRMEVG